VKISKEEHKSLALWAAECAEHVLPYFEKKYSKDSRPRKAIEACRAWANDSIRIGEARNAAFAAHAAARNAKKDNHLAACFAARATGHVAAIAHVPKHVVAMMSYAVKAAEAAGVLNEREWQYQHLPQNLQSIIENYEKR
jgi:hypothetical protein